MLVKYIVVAITIMLRDKTSNFTLKKPLFRCLIISFEIFHVIFLFDYF